MLVDDDSDTDAAAVVGEEMAPAPQVMGAVYGPVHGEGETAISVGTDTSFITD